jgi:hypothetical protein
MARWRVRSGVLSGNSAKDDLEDWLVLYRRRLATRPANLLSDVAADLRSLLNHNRRPHPN